MLTVAYNARWILDRKEWDYDDADEEIELFLKRLSQAWPDRERHDLGKLADELARLVAGTDRQPTTELQIAPETWMEWVSIIRLGATPPFGRFDFLNDCWNEIGRYLTPLVDRPVSESWWSALPGHLYPGDLYTRAVQAVVHTAFPADEGRWERELERVANIRARASMLLPLFSADPAGTWAAVKKFLEELAHEDPSPVEAELDGIVGYLRILGEGQHRVVTVRTLRRWECALRVAIAPSTVTIAYSDRVEAAIQAYLAEVLGSETAREWQALILPTGFSWEKLFTAMVNAGPRLWPDPPEEEPHDEGGRQA